MILSSFPIFGNLERHQSSKATLTISFFAVIWVTWTMIDGMVIPNLGTIIISHEHPNSSPSMNKSFRISCKGLSEYPLYFISKCNGLAVGRYRRYRYVIFSRMGIARVCFQTNRIGFNSETNGENHV